jgi:phosphoadenosine phosphosulfate reductase
VLLAKLAIELDAKIPILFLDTGYHFAETYAYRDRIASEWQLNLINLLPARRPLPSRRPSTGLLYQSAPDQCCKLRKVEPLFKAVAGTACGSRVCAGSRQRAERA